MLFTWGEGGATGWAPRREGTLINHRIRGGKLSGRQPRCPQELFFHYLRGKMGIPDSDLQLEVRSTSASLTTRCLARDQCRYALLSQHSLDRLEIAEFTAANSSPRLIFADLHRATIELLMLLLCGL